MRCFAAIDIPGELRARLAELQDVLRRAEADVRWVARDSLHLTLAFYGEQDAAGVERLSTSLAAAAAATAPLRLTVEGAGAFPERGEPRVVWAGCKGDLRELAALAAAAGPPDEHPFVAHVTIGRVKSARNTARLREALRAGMLGAFEAAELVLYRSTLRPSGPVYERIAAFPFRSGR